MYKETHMVPCEYVMGNVASITLPTQVQGTCLLFLLCKLCVKHVCALFPNDHLVKMSLLSQFPFIQSQAGNIFLGLITNLSVGFKETQWWRNQNLEENPWFCLSPVLTSQRHLESICIKTILGSFARLISKDT